MSAYATILGTVTDATTGAPLGEVFVQVWTNGMSAPATTYTNFDGAYSFVLFPGTYALEFTLPGYVPVMVQNVALGVEVVLNEALVPGDGPIPPFPPVPSPPPPPPPPVNAISGTVTDAKSSSPIAFAQLEVQSPALPPNIEGIGVPANGGYYQFLDLPPGTYELWCVAEGYATYQQSGIVVTSGEATVVNVAMEPA